MSIEELKRVVEEAEAKAAALWSSYKVQDEAAAVARRVWHDAYTPAERLGELLKLAEGLNLAQVDDAGFERVVRGE